MADLTDEQKGKIAKKEREITELEDSLNSLKGREKREVKDRIEVMKRMLRCMKPIVTTK